MSFLGRVPCGQVLETLLAGLFETFPEDRLSAEKVSFCKGEWGTGVLAKKFPGTKDWGGVEKHLRNRRARGFLSTKERFTSDRAELTQAELSGWCMKADTTIFFNIQYCISEYRVGGSP